MKIINNNLKVYKYNKDINKIDKENNIKKKQFIQNFKINFL